MLKKIAFVGFCVALVIICALVFFPSSPKPVYSFTSGQANIAEELFLDWEVLDHLECPADNMLCNYFRQVQTEARRDRSYVEDAFRRASGKRIDLLLMYHRTMAQTSGRTLEEIGQDQVRQNVLEANSLVEKHLLKWKPDVIGVESCYGDGCGLDAEMKDSERIAGIMGIPFDPAVLKNGFALILAESWHLQFAQKYPDMALRGIDHFDFQLLDQWIVMAGTPTGKIEWPAVRLLWRLRSQYALARMINLLQDGQRGVIVMGSAHGPDFKVLMPALGIEGGIYSAIPKGVQLKEF